MSNYKSYSCYNLLKYLDSWYEHDTDRTNYAEYLLTMQNVSSVKDMIGIYNRVLWKFILNYNGLGKEDLVSNTWYDINMLSDDTKIYWRSLDVFLNENIERLFNSQEYSDKLAYECITNLREARNCAGIRNYIFSKSSDIVTSSKDKIMSSLAVINEAPDHISPYNLDTNGYLDYKSKYIENVKYLISLGFVRSIKDTTFEMKTKISYMPDAKSWVYLILACIVLIPLVALFMHYAFIGIFFIICILALLKMIK